MKQGRGFTLIELMIVVAVVAILAAIAYPSYTSFVQKSRRAEVKSFLLDMQMREERWRAERPSFATTAELGLDAAITAHPSAKWYTVTITGVSATDYTITATAKSTQTSDKQGSTSCTPLTLTKLTKAPAACW